ncbi:MAG: hypothetical protein PUA64_02350 [Treponema sp.]|nr:hypothetical protein [Treponema sp.]
MPKKAFFFHTFPVHRHLGKAVRLSTLTHSAALAAATYSNDSKSICALSISPV